MAVQVPVWAREFVVSEQEVEVDGTVYSFWVLMRELAELRNFVGFPGGFLFISEEVPAEYRKYMLRHEVREFTSRAGQAGRCLATLQQELNEVPDDIRADYIRFRRQFFRDLSAYYARREGSDELKREVAASLVYLENLPF